MTHTADGCVDQYLFLLAFIFYCSRDSGVGDFGREGIETFVHDHNCTDLCRSLSLDTSYPLVMPKDGEEDGNLEGENGDLSDSESNGDGEPLTVYH